MKCFVCGYEMKTVEEGFHARKNAYNGLTNWYSFYYCVKCDMPVKMKCTAKVE